MSVGKISFRGVEAPVPQQPQEKTQVAFKGQENPIDEEKSNATKYMIGATILAGVATLAVLGYHGHLGEGIQKFLGGAKKVAKDAGKDTPKPTPVGTPTAPTSQAVNEVTEAVAQEAKTILTGEEAVKSINEYFAKFEPNSKAFVPKNNKDVVIVFRAPNKSIESKNVYKLDEFKWNSSASEIDAESLSGVYLEEYSLHRKKANIKLGNGAYMQIERNISPSLTPDAKGVKTEINVDSPVLGPISYLKHTGQDKKVAEAITMSNSKGEFSIIRDCDDDFSKAKGLFRNALGLFND